jgi:hypothetical protein
MAKDIGFLAKTEVSRRGFLRKNILYVEYIFIKILKYSCCKILNLKYIKYYINLKCIRQNIFYSI